MVVPYGLFRIGKIQAMLPDLGTAFESIHVLGAKSRSFEISLMAGYLQCDAVITRSIFSQILTIDTP